MSKLWILLSVTIIILATESNGFTVNSKRQLLKYGERGGGFPRFVHPRIRSEVARFRQSQENQLRKLIRNALEIKEDEASLFEEERKGLRDYMIIRKFW